MTMETVRLSFVKKEFLVKHSDTLHLVERSSVFLYIGLQQAIYMPRLGLCNNLIVMAKKS